MVLLLLSHYGLHPIFAESQESVDCAKRYIGNPYDMTTQANEYCAEAHDKKDQLFLEKFDDGTALINSVPFSLDRSIFKPQPDGSLSVTEEDYKAWEKKAHKEGSLNPLRLQGQNREDWSQLLDEQPTSMARFIQDVDRLRERLKEWIRKNRDLESLNPVEKRMYQQIDSIQIVENSFCEVRTYGTFAYNGYRNEILYCPQDTRMPAPARLHGLAHSMMRALDPCLLDAYKLNYQQSDLDSPAFSRCLTEGGGGLKPEEATQTKALLKQWKEQGAKVYMTKALPPVIAIVLDRLAECGIVEKPPAGVNSGSHPMRSLSTCIDDKFERIKEVRPIPWTNRKAPKNASEIPAPFRMDFEVSGWLQDFGLACNPEKMDYFADAASALILQDEYKAQSRANDQAKKWEAAMMYSTNGSCHKMLNFANGFGSNIGGEEKARLALAIPELRDRLGCSANYSERPICDSLELVESGRQTGRGREVKGHR